MPNIAMGPKDGRRHSERAAARGACVDTGPVMRAWLGQCRGVGATLRQRPRAVLG